ncbi:transposase [Xenorhabdus littoralis]|uniref:transposase n=1 Tax=Xenorhabdus littoralis TaxID=2582835 RepID=UPI0029E7CC1E|nr:transposase [Xenorhabdus sp. psl]MDX7993182.1 hypothetical protein [Xenorhabdus sp. psl]
MIKWNQEKRQYLAEFKLEAVQQVVLHQQQVTAVVRSLNLDDSVLRRWIRQYKAEMQGITPVGKALTPDQCRMQEF